ncbi:MAG: hypothetical protein OHK0039_24690 [Bacteroidia bacterium]
MKRFNVRVYGILVEAGQLLLTDEICKGMPMTKLPGGGLQFGEGLAAGLQREWLEELNVEIEVGEVFYVNPFLQISAFNPDDELIAVYFRIARRGPLDVPFRTTPIDFDEAIEDAQVFRWVPLEKLQAEDFTFPTDRAMVPVLRAAFGL